MGETMGLSTTIPESKLGLLEQTIDGILSQVAPSNLNQSVWIGSFEVIYEAATSMEPNDNEVVYLLLVSSVRRYIKEQSYIKLEEFYSKTDLEDLDSASFFGMYHEEYIKFQEKVQKLSVLYSFFSKHFCKFEHEDEFSVKNRDRMRYPSIRDVLLKIWKEEIHNKLVEDYFFKYLANFYRNGGSRFMNPIVYKCLTCCLDVIDHGLYLQDFVFLPLTKNCSENVFVRDVFTEGSSISDKAIVVKVTEFYVLEKSIIYDYLSYNGRYSSNVLKNLRMRLLAGRESFFVDYFFDAIKNRRFKDEIVSLFEFLADTKSIRKNILKWLNKYLLDFLDETLRIRECLDNKDYDQFMQNFRKCEELLLEVHLMLERYSGRYEAFVNTIYKEFIALQEDCESFPHMVSHLISRCLNEVMTSKKYSRRDLSDLFGYSSPTEPHMMTHLFLLLNDRSVLLELLYKDMGYRLLLFDNVSIVKENELCSCLQKQLISLNVHRLIRMCQEYSSFKSEKKKFHGWLKNEYPAVPKFDINLLGTSCWPFKEAILLEPLPEFKEKEEIVGKYLAEMKKDVSSTVHQIFSNGELSFQVNNKTYILSCNYVIMNILMLFNQRKIMYRKKIMDILKITEANCLSYMEILLRKNLVLEFEENGYPAYIVNPNFTHKGQKIRIDSFTEDEKLSEKSNKHKRGSDNSAGDGKEYLALLVQSRMMKIMKEKKIMDEHELIRLVKEGSVRYSHMPDLIKEQIGILVEKEYIGRNGHLQYKE